MSVDLALSKSLLKQSLGDLLPPQVSTNFDYSMGPHGSNGNTLNLKITSEINNFSRDYVLVKVPIINFDRTLGNNKVFMLQADEERRYLGFERGGDLVCPAQNSVEDLAAILKGLSERQANDVSKRISPLSKYHVSELVVKIAEAQLFESFDVKATALAWEKSINAITSNSDVLVKTIARPSMVNVLIKRDGELIFIDLTEEEAFKSPLYDALVLIFALTDQQFRNRNLKALLDVYSKAFVEALDQRHVRGLNFDENVFESHLKAMLPLVKFETLLVMETPCLKQNCAYSLKYPQISYEDCIEAVSNRIDGAFDVKDYQLVPLDERNGHLGQYFSLKVELDKNRKLNMFTKLLSVVDNSSLSDYVQSGLSAKEQFFYRTFVAELHRHGLGSLVDFAPNCYFDRLNDVLIMEDLAEQGYKAFSTSAQVGADVLRSAFFTCAKLHASSILLEERMSKSLYELYGSFLGDDVFREREGCPASPCLPEPSRPAVDQLIDSLVSDQAGQLSREDFRLKAHHILQVISKRLSVSSEFKNVICHGDFYSSNLLTKASVSKMVDFQLIRYTLPVNDLLFLSYVSSSKQVRDNHLQALLGEYYKELGRILGTFGFDINKVYSPEVFWKSVRLATPITIMQAILYGHLLQAPAKEKAEIFSDREKYTYYVRDNRREYIKYMMSVSEEFTKRVKELIDDLYGACVDKLVV